MFCPTLTRLDGLLGSIPDSFVSGIDPDTGFHWAGFEDGGYNSIPELTNVTGGATVSNGVLLWGYKDSTARIVKLPYPLIDNYDPYD